MGTYTLDFTDFMVFHWSLCDLYELLFSPCFCATSITISTMSIRFASWKLWRRVLYVAFFPCLVFQARNVANLCGSGTQMSVVIYIEECKSAGVCVCVCVCVYTCIVMGSANLRVAVSSWSSIMFSLWVSSSPKNGSTDFHLGNDLAISCKLVTGWFCSAAGSLEMQSFRDSTEAIMIHMVSDMPEHFCRMKIIHIQTWEDWYR